MVNKNKKKAELRGEHVSKINDFSFNVFGLAHLPFIVEQGQACEVVDSLDVIQFEWVIGVGNDVHNNKVSSDLDVRSNEEGFDSDQAPMFQEDYPKFVVANLVEVIMVVKNKGLDPTKHSAVTFKDNPKFFIVDRRRMTKGSKSNKPSQSD